MIVSQYFCIELKEQVEVLTSVFDVLISLFVPQIQKSDFCHVVISCLSTL